MNSRKPYSSTVTRLATGCLLAAAALTACDTNTGPEHAPDFFPLVVGNTWTYAPEDPVYGTPFQWSVVETQGDTATLARPAGGSHSGTVTLLNRTDEVDIQVGDDGFAPLYRFTVGASWTRNDPWECDDGAGQLAVVETETITTPAGTFEDVLRIERSTTATCADAGTMTEWWAPGVGLVQWDELNFYGGGPVRYYLMDYDVG